MLCGCDLKEQLTGRELGEELLISRSMLRAEEEVFLDDVTVRELSETLNVPVKAVYSDGYELLDALLGK